MDMGQFVKVEQMEGANNQYRITTSNGYVFQSYNTIIAFYCWDGISGTTYLDREMWDYSRTTGKYRNKFLGETKADTERKIKSGEYILTNLN